MADHVPPFAPESTRRRFLQSGALALGGMAFSALQPRGGGDGPRARPHVPRARNVIYLHMEGAPSPLDMFDPKPELQKHDGKKCPDAFLQKERFAFIRGTPKLLGSPYKFAKQGQCGAEISELLPFTSKIVDDLAIVKSCVTDAFNHAPAELFINSGLARVGRPSMGSWLTYGLGTENRDLPGFVVMLSGGGQPSGGCSCWSSGFLPTVHQGVPLRSAGDPVLFVRNPEGVSAETRRRSLDALRDLNQQRLEAVGDPEIATRIASYELAYRMQSSVPELMDFAGEKPETLAMYGVEKGKPSFAANCLLARRLVERGVRFVQIYSGGAHNDDNWDAHTDMVRNHGKHAGNTDKPIAGLLKDLKARGLLDSTLVVWGGEFGRQPTAEYATGTGRDHNPYGFTMWMAGGGVRGGQVIGSTDRLGESPKDRPIRPGDIHATMFHSLGIDPKTTFADHSGRRPNRNHQVREASRLILHARPRLPSAEVSGTLPFNKWPYHHPPCYSGRFPHLT